jgi:glucose-1-phosphate thymidylyltransferase
MSDVLPHITRRELVRGILLAGGTGSRLLPATRVISKQLLPVFDKPMIYYPLCTLIDAGVREVLVITTPTDQQRFRRLLGDGAQWGLRLDYAAQAHPEGIAQAFTIADTFLAGVPAALALGDNLFGGVDLRAARRRDWDMTGAHLFARAVADPTAYGIVELDDDGRPLSIVEKPATPRSRYAVTGLYLYDSDVTGIARSLTPSRRGEFEITDINLTYLERGSLTVTVLPRTAAWFDMGTFAGLARAAAYVQAFEERHGRKLGCVEEAAWRADHIDDAQLRELAEPQISSGYGDYLLGLLDREGARCRSEPKSARESPCRPEIEKSRLAAPGRRVPAGVAETADNR